MAGFTKLVKAFGEVKKRDSESVANVSHINQINTAVTQFVLADESL